MRVLRMVLPVLGVVIVAGCTTPPGAGVVDPTPLVVPDPSALASDELTHLGRRDLDAGNNGLAVEHFRAAADRNGNDATAWIGLAAAYDNLARFDLADQAYAHAVALQGETLTLLNNIGYSYYLRGDRVRALTKLRHAATLFPNNAVIENNLRLVRSGELPNRRAAP